MAIFDLSEVFTVRRFLTAVLAPLTLVIGLAVLAPAAGAATAVTLPTVKGSFNQTPTITFPKSKAPTTLQVSYLHKGTGAKVVAGELLVANYTGWVWGGKVFDSSFSRGQLAGFPIGVGQVIPGWDSGLVGVPVGSRVLLVIPPAQGYGPSGNTAAGIKGTDDIVFVVDVVAAYNAKVTGDPHATIEKTSTNGISIRGKTTAAPTIKIAKGTKKPTALSTTLLSQGHGAKVTSGLVVLQMVVVDWTGKVQYSTWQIKAPYGQNIGVTGQPGDFDKLIGMKLGSRVLFELPASGGQGPYAAVADVVAEPHDGAAKAS